MLWNYKIAELKRGYHDAEGAVRRHVKSEHGGIATYLLEQELSLTGISEIQRQLLSCLLNGKNDKEIGKELGIAQSTVRNHRFKLREKEKQAKLFLAMMEQLACQTEKPIEKSDTGNLEELHASATMVDDRYSISDVERQKVVQTYMDENGALKQFPSKEKKKIILLGEIIRNFKPDAEYSEKEVNRVLKRIYEQDYPIRRAAFAAFSKKIREYENVTATAYNAQVQTEKTLANMQGCFKRYMGWTG